MLADKVTASLLIQLAWYTQLELSGKTHTENLGQKTPVAHSSKSRTIQYPTAVSYMTGLTNSCIVLLVLLSYYHLVINSPDTLVSRGILDSFSQGKLTFLNHITNKKYLGLSTTIIVLLITFKLTSSTSFNVPQIFHKVIGYMNSNYRFLSSNLGFNSRFSGSSSSSTRSREARLALKNGGEIGGLSNDGNTCFMNSVIQSLASSTQLGNFFNDNLFTEVEVHSDGKVTKVKTGQPRSELVFTRALKSLIDDVNGAYGARGKEFSTRPLLNKMPNGPKQNFFTGYNQEDAQEFYQLAMRLVEKEYKKISISRESTPEPEGAENREKSPRFIDASNVPGYITGCNQLGKLGYVFVPAHQVDPNIPDEAKKLFPLELITPVDGISAERIGCISCGEVGGIRYSVISGLSLNLPYDLSSYSGYKLVDLLKEWMKPEIIDEVNCNRCGLAQTREFLLESIETSTNEKLVSDFSKRVNEIDQELAKDHISDEVFERLSTKRMIRKTRKTKQILLSRPPPLLCIHINRSVFDPRTYMIVKNSKAVAFPSKLDLNPYVAEPKDINMDARLAFRKQDEGNKSQTQEEDEDMDDGEFTPAEPTIAVPGNPDLVYNLKAVVSHYGTHNYGHYICYRRLRGSWWRISDESVYVVTEREVLSSQGTFMLFYEMSDGKEESFEELTDDEKTEDTKEAEVQSSSLLDLEDEQDANGANGRPSMFENADSLKGSTEDVAELFPNSKFELGEERAYHV